MRTQLYCVKAISGLHFGVGQGVNDIDLPTARDPVTGHPIGPGSTLKGVLRDLHDGRSKGTADRPTFEAIFGPDTQNAAAHSSCVSFGDARTLCLAVRSFRGTFAYVTSPTALRLFSADAKRAGWNKLPDIKTLAENQTCEAIPTTGSLLTLDGDGGTIVLGDADLKPWQDRSLADQWACELLKLMPLLPAGQGLNPDLFKPRFAIICDLVFDYLCECALPVVAHNAIDDTTGTVRGGALWYEEHIPPESILYGLLYSEAGKHPTGKLSDVNALRYLCNQPEDLQLGGKATTGKGFATLHFPVPS